jgi:hypothetical protein
VTYSFESATYQTIADFGSGPVWLSDNDSVMFAWQNKVFLVSQTHPHPRELLSVAPDQIGGLTISRDNRTVVFQRSSTEADIWLATLK